MSALDVHAGLMAHEARLMEQEALRAEAEELSARYGVPVSPQLRRGEDGLSAEVGKVSVSGPADEVREWLERHAGCEAPAVAPLPGATAGQDG